MAKTVVLPMVAAGFGGVAVFCLTFAALNGLEWYTNRQRLDSVTQATLAFGWGIVGMLAVLVALAAFAVIVLSEVRDGEAHEGLG